MCVGGEVINVQAVEGDPDAVHVTVAERKWWGRKDLDLPNATRVRVSRPLEGVIMSGDRLWWQGDLAFWTRPDEFEEIRLKKIGYSHQG